MEIALKIAQLQTLPISELRHLWKHYFGTECEAQKREFYISRIAYRMQELAYGGLNASTKKVISELCLEKKKKKGLHLPPEGTRIVREYKGIEHSVKIVPGGFEYQGNKYKSLSSVAKLITGFKISGNHFFELEKYKG